MENFPQNSNYNPMNQESQINNYLNEMIPLEPFSQLLNATLTASTMYEGINNLYTSVHRYTISPLKQSDQRQIHEKVKQVSQKNRQLIRKTLNLRAKLVSKMNLSQKSESQATELEYEFVKREINDLKEDLKKELRVTKNIQHYQRQQGIKKQSKSSNIQTRFLLNSAQLKTFRKAFTYLHTECLQSRFDLQLIGSVWQKKKNSSCIRFVINLTHL